jgi:hypothetical protein
MMPKVLLIGGDRPEALFRLARQASALTVMCLTRNELRSISGYRLPATVTLMCGDPAAMRRGQTPELIGAFDAVYVTPATPSWVETARKFCRPGAWPEQIGD